MGQLQLVKAANNAISAVITFTVSSTLAGQSLVMGVFNASSSSVTSVDDGHSGSWVTRSTTGVNLHWVDILSCPASVTSIIFTASVADVMLGFLMSRDDILAFDQIVAQRNQSAVTTWTSNTSAAMAQNSEIGFGMAASSVSGGLISGAGSGWTAGSSATVTGGVLDDASGDSGFMETQIFSAGGTTSATGSCDVSANPKSILALYKLITADTLFGQACY